MKWFPGKLMFNTFKIPQKYVTIDKLNEIFVSWVVRIEGILAFRATLQN